MKYIQQFFLLLCLVFSFINGMEQNDYNKTALRGKAYTNLTLRRSNGSEITLKSDINPKTKFQLDEDFKEIVKQDPSIVNMGVVSKHGTDKGTTLLHVAVGEKNKEIVAFLVNNGARIDKKDVYENTSFLRALKSQDTTMFKLFVPRITKSIVIDILLDDSPWVQKETIRLLDFLNSHEFEQERIKLIKTTLHCFKHVEKQRKFKIPRPIKNILLFDIEGGIIMMKKLTNFNKKLEADDFIGQK